MRARPSESLFTDRKLLQFLNLRRRAQNGAARIWCRLERTQTESIWRTSLATTAALLIFVLILWPASTQAQSATVSVHELQIPRKARGEFDQGVRCLEKGDATEGLAHLEQAIQRYGNFYEAYYEKGVAELMLQRKNEALQSFQTAIDLSAGRYARAYFGYGVVLSQLGRPEEAEPIVRRGLSEDSTLSDGYAILSMVLFHKGRLKEAEEAAREALRLPNPCTMAALLTLGFVHMRMHDYRSEVEDLEGYLKAVGSSPYKHDPEFMQYIKQKLEEARAKSAEEKRAGVVSCPTPGCS